jgi:integrase
VPDFSLIQIRTSPFWYVTWNEGGRSQRVSTRTRDRTEAEAFLAAFRLEAAEEPVADLSVSQALDWYWDTHGKTLMKPQSAELAIRYLKPFFGATPASTLTLAKQEAYVGHRRESGAGHESIRRDLSVLSAALGRAVRYKKLDHKPPMLSLTPAPPRERWLTRKEVAAVLRQMRKPVRNKIHRHVILFTRLALYTGARTGAILDLTWDRVDFHRGLIDFRKPGRRETKKRRTITPMTRKVRRMLLHAHKHAASRFVVAWAGEGIGRVAKAVIAHAEKAGVEGFSPHVLRHTFASWAVQKRVPIYTIGKALGQTVASTTERYAKLAPDDVRDAMELAGKK